MRSTELKNETVTNNRVAERWAPRMAAIAALLLLVSLSATFAGRATGHTEQQQGRGSAQPSNVDWKAVERAMGRPGAMQPGDVYKFSMPRGETGAGATGCARQNEYGEGVDKVGLRNPIV